MSPFQMVLAVRSISMLQHQPLTDHSRFKLLKKNLEDRHLVDISLSHTTLSIHRSFATHILGLIEDAGHHQLRVVFGRALLMVRTAFPMGSDIQAPTNHQWQQAQDVLPQVLSLASIYKKHVLKLLPTLQFAGLLADVANILWEKGQTSDAFQIIEVGEEVCEALEKDPEIVPIHANITAIAGAVYAEVGFSGRAVAKVKLLKNLELRMLRLQYLEKEEKVKKHDGMLLSNGYNDYGCVLIQSEEWEEAESIHQKALALKTKYSTEADNPVQFGESYKNLAYVRLAQGKGPEAVDLAKRAYEGYSKEISEMNAATQKVKFVYANILLNTGDIQASKRLNKSVFNVRV